MEAEKNTKSSGRVAALVITFALAGCGVAGDQEASARRDVRSDRLEVAASTTQGSVRLAFDRRAIRAEVSALDFAVKKIAVFYEDAPHSDERQGQDPRARDHCSLAGAGFISSAVNQPVHLDLTRLGLASGIEFLAPVGKVREIRILIDGARVATDSGSLALSPYESCSSDGGSDQLGVIRFVSGRSDFEISGTPSPTLFEMAALFDPNRDISLHPRALASEYRVRAVDHGTQQLSGYLRPEMISAPVLGPVPASTPIHLAIGLPVRDRPAFDQLARDVSDPASPLFRQFLTPEQVTGRFGPSEADYQKLIDWAISKNFVVEKTSSSRALLSVVGRATDVEQAFYVRLFYATRPDGTTFYRPDREPSLDLSMTVLSVPGLQNYDVPKAQRGSEAGGGLYTAVDLRTAYGCRSLTGKGQALGVRASKGLVASEVEGYELRYGIPAVRDGHGLSTYVPVNVTLHGWADGSQPAEELETTADVELGVAMAPGLDSVEVHIVEACANDAALFDAFVKPEPGQPLARQISSSYSLCYDASIEASVGKMIIQGQSFFQASGDSGGYPPNNGGFTYDMIYVGGTSLVMSGLGERYESESAWLDLQTGHSGGGGCAPASGQPPYQAGMTLCPNGSGGFGRALPDVSAVASSVAVFSPTNCPLTRACNFGGTSASTPIWAGFLATVNQQSFEHGLNGVGFAGPAMYAIAKSPAYSYAFDDVAMGGTQSSQGGQNYPATIGYDLATGWGSPKCGLVDELACVKCGGGSSCTHLESDANNCGHCGFVCPSGQTCREGQCGRIFAAADVEPDVAHLCTFGRGFTAGALVQVGFGASAEHGAGSGTAGEFGTGFVTACDGSNATTCAGGLARGEWQFVADFGGAFFSFGRLACTGDELNRVGTISVWDLATNELYLDHLPGAVFCSRVFYPDGSIQLVPGDQNAIGPVKGGCAAGLESVRALP